MRHTPGPWHVQGNEIVGVDVTPKTKIIATSRDNPAWDSDAFRIVTCVNACEGIRDPGVVPDILYLLIEVLPYIETGESDPVYKPGAVRKVTQKIRDILARAERGK